jgi:acetyl-CoA carboxylase carboxyltransferase component
LPGPKNAETKKLSRKNSEELRAKVKASYEEQTDIRYGAARGWIDSIIQPHETRDVLVQLLRYVARPPAKGRFHMGVVQV